jgi:hypothetical protein
MDLTGTNVVPLPISYGCYGTPAKPLTTIDRLYQDNVAQCPGME